MHTLFLRIAFVPVRHAVCFHQRPRPVSSSLRRQPIRMHTHVRPCAPPLHVSVQPLLRVTVGIIREQDAMLGRWATSRKVKGSNTGICSVISTLPLPTHSCLSKMYLKHFQQLWIKVSSKKLKVKSKRIKGQLIRS